MEVNLAYRSEDMLGEGPVWVSEEQALYWVDIERPVLQRWHPQSGDYTRWQMPNQIGCFALREQGGAVVALRTGFAFLDFERDLVIPLIDPEADKPFTRFNDGKVDRHGRLWAGTMDDEFARYRGGLYCLDPDGSCRQIKTGIGISNGLGWSPDNRVMYYTDSAKHTIWAYDFDLENGEISNQRVFARTPADYVPDGLTVDAEGYLWSAKWDGWKVVRYAPDGSVDREVHMPVQRPTSCTFGGSDLKQLFITSASTGLTEPELQNQPLAGCVFVFNTDIPGIAEPRYAG